MIDLETYIHDLEWIKSWLLKDPSFGMRGGYSKGVWQCDVLSYHQWYLDIINTWTNTSVDEVSNCRTVVLVWLLSKLLYRSITKGVNLKSVYNINVCIYSIYDADIFISNHLDGLVQERRNSSAICSYVCYRQNMPMVHTCVSTEGPPRVVNNRNLLSHP